MPLCAPTTSPQVFDIRVSSTTRLHILELLFMLTSRLAGSSHLSLLPWKNGLDSYSTRAAYHPWYIPVSLCTDNISSTPKLVDPLIGKQKGIARHCRHQQGAMRPLGPTIYPRKGSERWVCLIFYSVVLIRKYFSIHTSTYLSTGHLTRHTPVPSYFLTNVYNVTRRSLSRPHYPRNNTGKFFACISITSGDLLNVHSLSHW